MCLAACATDFTRSGFGVLQLTETLAIPLGPGDSLVPNCDQRYDLNVDEDFSTSGCIQAGEGGVQASLDRSFAYLASKGFSLNPLASRPGSHIFCRGREEVRVVPLTAFGDDPARVLTIEFVYVDRSDAPCAPR